MTPAIKCLILLAIVALLFVTEMIPLAMTAIGASVACCALGLVPENQIFLGLADSFWRHVCSWRSNVLYRAGPKNWRRRCTDVWQR